MADDNNKTDSFSPEYPKPQEKPKKEEEKDLTKKIGDKMKEEAGEKQREVKFGDETIEKMVQEGDDFIKPEDKEEIGAEREEIVNEAGKDVGKFKQGVEEAIDGKSKKEISDNAKREWEKFKKRQESEELHWTSNATRKELEQKIEELSARKLEVEKLINDFNSVGKENKNRDLIDSYRKEKEELETRLQRLNYRLKTMPEKEQIQAEELNEKEKREAQEKLLEEIFKNSAGGIHTAFHDKGFSDKNYGEIKDSFKKDSLNYFGSDVNSSFSIVDKTFQKEGINEAVAIVPVSVKVYGEEEYEEGSIIKKKKKRRIETGKRDAGFDEIKESGRKEKAYKFVYKTIDDENSEYHVPDGRYGQVMLAELFLPESIALKILEEIKSRPKFAREIVERLVKEEMKQDKWDAGDRNKDEISLCPPYEKWAENKGGKSKMYIQEPDANFNEEFNSDYVVDVEKGRLQEMSAKPVETIEPKTEPSQENNTDNETVDTTQEQQTPPEEPEKEMTEEEKEIENIINKVKNEGKISHKEGEFILEKIQEKESEFYKETSKEEREKLGKEFLKYDEIDDEEKRRRESEIEEAKKKFAIDAEVEAENKEEIERKIGELEKEMKEKFEKYAKMDEELRAIYESEDTAGRKELGPVSDQMKEVFKYRLKFAKLDYLRQSLTDKNAESIEEQIKDPKALLNSCDRRKTEIEKYEKVIAMMDKKFEELSEEEKSFFEKLLKWIKHNPKKTALIAVLLVAGVMIAPHAMPYITAENLGKLAIAGGAVVALKKFKPQLKRLAEIGGTAAIVGLLLLNDNWGSVDDFAEWACGMKIPTWAKRFEDKSKK